MTRNVVVVHEEENLELAEKGMKDYRFRHLPVVEGNKLVGLISERDLLRAAVSTLDSDHALRDDNLKRYFFVREIMAEDVTTVQPDALLRDAARLLRGKKIGCLPVTEEDGTLVGILTQSDLVTLACTFLDAQESQPISGQHAARP